MYQQIELWGEKNEKMKEKSKSFHCKADRQGRLSPCLVCSVCPFVCQSVCIYLLFQHLFQLFFETCCCFFAKKPLEQRSLAGLCNVNCKLAIDREREGVRCKMWRCQRTEPVSAFFFFFLFVLTLSILSFDFKVQAATVVIIVVVIVVSAAFTVAFVEQSKNQNQ